MKNRSYFSLFLAITLIALPMMTFATEGHQRIVWRQKSSASTGLYTTRNYFVTQGISLGASAVYYFGDVDNEGLAFHGGFNVENLSLGGGLQFSYQMPIGNHCNIKFGLMGGTLRGNNEAKFKSLPEPRDDYRRFNAIIVQPAVGVQYYPFTNAGFYLYGGLTITGSIITDYQFWYMKRVEGGKERTLLQGKTYGILPMVQLGLGYSWRLSDSWLLSLEVMLQEGLIDTYYMNLDAFPLAPGQNSDGVKLGNDFGKWVDKNGKEHIHWNDGWFQVGLTITYRWSNCEYCRTIDNYGNVRKGRR